MQEIETLKRKLLSIAYHLEDGDRYSFICENEMYRLETSGTNGYADGFALTVSHEGKCVTFIVPQELLDHPISQLFEGAIFSNHNEGIFITWKP